MCHHLLATFGCHLIIIIRNFFVTVNTFMQLFISFAYISLYATCCCCKITVTRKGLIGLFSDRLKKLRKNKKKTQQDMADFLGISRQGYAKYENGHAEADYETLNKLSNLFNVTTDYLLGSTDNPEKEPHNERDAIIHKIATEFPDIDLMFHDLANMDADDLKEVYEFIKFKSRDK